MRMLDVRRFTFHSRRYEKSFGILSKSAQYARVGRGLAEFRTFDGVAFYKLAMIVRVGEVPDRLPYRRPL